MCLKGEGIKELLKGWWMGYDFSVSPFHFGSKVESFEIRLENFETKRCLTMSQLGRKGP